MRKYVVAAACAAFVGAAPAQAAKPGGGGGGTPITHNPIVFVHGWNSSGTVWNTMISRFSADGWTSAELNNWSYNTSQSNATTASQLSTKINDVLKRTGASKVDVITHSMGGLSSRYYARNLGGDLKIDDWVSLGGPNHGTNWAYACYPFSAGCRHMIPGSGFLDALNAGDETPGAVRYGTFWSSCDEIINPDTSTQLSGATNVNVGCLGHSALRTDAGVFARVRDFIR